MSLNRRQIAVRTARLRSKSKTPTSDIGHCLREVRECLAVPQRYGTAQEAADHVARMHREPNLSLIPRGVPIWWSGGSQGAGHVALSTGFLSKCFSTDILRTGYFDRVDIALIHQKWGLTYLGWSEDINGVTVYP